jgi:hypothetical protein
MCIWVKPAYNRLGNVITKIRSRSPKLSRQFLETFQDWVYVHLNQWTGASAATCTSFLFYVTEVPPSSVKLLLYMQLYTYWSDDTKVPPWTDVIQNNLCKSEQIETNNRITPTQSSNTDALTLTVILADNTTYWVNHKFLRTGRLFRKCHFEDSSTKQAT